MQIECSCMIVFVGASPGSDCRLPQGRARALYAAGYKTLSDVANAEPEVLVRTLDHLPRRVARQIVDSAKVSD